MIPELNALIEAIKKKPRPGKSKNQSAGIDEIRRTLDAYLAVLELEKSIWYRARRFFLLKPKGVIKP